MGAFGCLFFTCITLSSKLYGMLTDGRRHLGFVIYLFEDDSWVMEMDYIVR
jgi:hypothetical protein